MNKKSSKKLKVLKKPITAMNNELIMVNLYIEKLQQASRIDLNMPLKDFVTARR